MNKKNKKAFTLIELLVVIWLIIILWVTISSLNFNKLTNIQRAEMFSNKIITQIENVRDNSLVWKWISDQNSLNWFAKVERWDILIEKWTSTQKSSFKIFIYENDIDKKELSKIEIENVEKIENLVCEREWEKDSVNIAFVWWKTSIEECANSSKINIFTSYNSEKSQIEFDVVSWLVKRVKK